MAKAKVATVAPTREERSEKRMEDSFVTLKTIYFYSTHTQNATRKLSTSQHPTA
jgi:hypothetical protein